MLRNRISDHKNTFRLCSTFIRTNQDRRRYKAPEKQTDYRFKYREIHGNFLFAMCIGVSDVNIFSKKFRILVFKGVSI